MFLSSFNSNRNSFNQWQNAGLTVAKSACLCQGKLIKCKCHIHYTTRRETLAKSIEHQLPSRYWEMIFLPSPGTTYKSQDSSWCDVPHVSSNNEPPLIRKTGPKDQQTPICSPYQANSWQAAATAVRPQGSGHIVALTHFSGETALWGFGARTEG